MADSIQVNTPARTSKKKKKKLPAGVVVKHGRWYVRIRYREYAGGPRHAAWRECAKNATAAKDVKQKLEEELTQHGAQSLLHSQDDFGGLADYYEANYLIPALYVDGKRVAGRRSIVGPKYQLRQLRALIGDRTKLRQMDFEFFRLLRLAMINDPVVMLRWVDEEHDGRMVKVKREVCRQRSIIDVDRKLEMLRHMMNVARKRLHWINHDPFGDADEPLITRADEKKRRRVMSFDEEEAILTFAVKPRAHLRLVIIGLVDTLMRGTEFFKLRVRDLAFDPRKVTVQQMNAKTLTERAAPMTNRFAVELKAWFEANELGPNDLVFTLKGKPIDGVRKSRTIVGVRKSWVTAKRLAGVGDLRLKDLRRTGATRLLRGGMAIEEISRILGHTTIEMTYEYIGVDKDTTGRANEILDAMHLEWENRVTTVH